MTTTKSMIEQYFDKISNHLAAIVASESDKIEQAATIVADQIAADKLVHIIGPGGHSNLGTQEVFFRAGGLMHINPILDEGTLLNNGALRSMAIERTPGYGVAVFQQQDFQPDDVLIIVNAYGINAAVIDIALCAKEKGMTLIAVSSISHANNTSADHPARHPSKRNLHQIADITLDCKVEIGDAVLEIAGVHEKVAAISTFANSFILNSLVATTVQKLSQRGIEPPLWRSGNAPGGDQWNNQFLHRFRHRIKAL